MHKDYASDHTTTLFTEAILTPKAEHSEYDDDVDVRRMEVPCRRSTDCRDGYKILTYVILGLPIAQFDVSTYQLYICGYKSAQESQKILPHLSIMQSGIATSLISAGSDCHFVMELHTSVYSDSPAQKREFIWFAVKRCDESSVNALLRDKMSYLLEPVWFRKGVGSNSSNYVAMLKLPPEQICVNVIAADSEELDIVCPGKGSRCHCLQTTICNALTVSRFIRICQSSGHGKTKQLISQLAKTLHSIYMSESNVNTEVLSVVSTAAQVSDLQSIIQVDSEGYDDMKPTILEGYEMSAGTTGFPLKMTSKECHEYEMESPEQEVEVEDFPCTHKPQIFLGRRLLLECPMCGMTFRSRRNRYKSLVSHIKRRHRDSQRRLLQIIRNKYVVTV